jgi:DedD protein
VQVKTKYRILGAVVIVSLAAIVLPRLWEDASGVPNMQLSFAIPKPASGVTATLPKSPTAPSASESEFTVVAKTPSKHSQPAVKQAVAQHAVQTPAAKTALASPAAVPVPVATAKAFPLSVPEAWVIQLGTFSNAANVAQLIAKLRKDGLTAYQRTKNVSNRNLIQVFVGPEIEKNKLDPLLKELHDKFNLRGVVRKYKV